MHAHAVLMAHVHEVNRRDIIGASCLGDIVIAYWFKKY